MLYLIEKLVEEDEFPLSIPYTLSCTCRIFSHFCSKISEAKLSERHLSFYGFLDGSSIVCEIHRDEDSTISLIYGSSPSERCIPSPRLTRAKFDASAAMQFSGSFADDEDDDSYEPSFEQLVAIRSHLLSIVGSTQFIRSQSEVSPRLQVSEVSLKSKLNVFVYILDEKWKTSFACSFRLMS